MKVWRFQLLCGEVTVAKLPCGEVTGNPIQVACFPGDVRVKEGLTDHT